MPLCLDASVAVAAFIPDPTRPSARRLLLESVRAGQLLLAPPLLLAETTSVLRRYVHRLVIPHTDAVAALQDLLAMPIRLVTDPAVYLRALALAQTLGQPRAYDVQYLAVAQIERSPIVTLDRGLHQSARALGIEAHLLA